MSLLTLPDELILQCSFHVVALDPLGPHTIIPLALICRAFNLVVSSHAFRARICRLMFDVGPVTRRLFHPRDSDLADELQRCCNVLKEIRRGDVTETEDSVVDDTLLSAYILMLNNDGKNYAQLEHAGLDAFVNKFITTRLWEGRETNQGWPLDSFMSSTALWLMWMTLTKQKLEAQDPEYRNILTRLIVPYVVLPHRYASASAPPNHFNLPLDSQNPYHQKPLITTAAQTPYPIYLSYPSYATPYFNASIPISQPLITIAAKLLFVAMKEMFPLRPPPHLPLAPGPGIVGVTQEDYMEINRSPGARLCRVVTWNWDTGSPNRVGGDDASEIDEGWEESKAWDTEWWRRLLCSYYNGKRPKHLPGNVFVPGSMRGSWAGKEYAPQGHLFLRLLGQPDISYPGIPDPRDPDYFTEDSIGLSVNRVFLDIQEHHKICECAQGSPHISESHPYVAPTYLFTPGSAGVSSSSPTAPTYLPIGQQLGRCGIVPIPAPLMFQAAAQRAGQDQGEQEGNEAQESDALERSLPTPRINVIDCSMSNAWLPGHLGGVSFSKLSTGNGKRDKVICAVDFQNPDVRNVLNRPEESECLALGGRRQQQDGQGKMNAFVYETYDPEKTSMHRGLGDSMSDAGNTFMSASSSSEHPTEDPHKCQRCLQREALIRIERKKAEHRSRVMLDRGLRSFGSGGYNWNHQDEDEDMDEDEDEDEDEEMGDEEDYEDEEMRDLDVDELGIDVDGIIAQTSSCSTDDASSSVGTDDDCMSSSPLVSFGDDDREQYLDADERKRKYYDKCRVGVECKGVADILLSGGTGPKSPVWQQCKMYGRVRPWDGLIGILKSVSTDNNTLANYFIFGYIVGENNFVGEWRLAASDPLCPSWGSAFVMSRKVDRAGGGGRAR